MKQKAGKNQDWIFDEQNVLVSTVAEVENVNNEVTFQDTEVCNIFRNGVSHLGEQSVRISCSSSGSICDIKSENHEEQQMDSVRVKQQNIATQSIAPLAAKCNSGNPMNKSTRLLYNRSLACSRSRKSRRQVQKERTDKFYPPLIEINPALQATVSKKVSKESCLSLEGLNGCHSSTITRSRAVLESPNFHSPVSSLPRIHRNQSLEAHLSKVRANRFRGSRSSTPSYVMHENLETLLLRREKTRLRVRKHRLKKKLALLGIKNEANECSSNWAD